MKKIHHLLFVFVLSLLVFSCKSKQTTTSTTTSTTKFNDKTFDPYFKGLGTEPFWNIEISEDFIVYKDIEGKVEVFSINDIHKAQDANIQLIRSENNNQKLNVTISQKSCSDGMSDNEFDYKTEVSIITKDKEQKLNGCGNYTIPLKLQGKWELISFNGNEIPADKYLKTPYLEFTEEKRIGGNASCNGFNGSIFIDNEHIRFSKLAVTRMMCVHENMESEFLKEIETITQYKISNNELQLFKGNELKMIFKKQ